MAGMSLDISSYVPMYNIIVSSVTGGNGGNYSVTVNGITLTYSGAPLTFGPFSHSSPFTGNVPVLVTAQDASPAPGSPVCNGSVMVDETICAPSGYYCDCADPSPPSNPGVIVSQSTPGTFNTDGYDQIYVLVDNNGLIITWQNQGIFSGLADGMYSVYAINVKDFDRTALVAALVQAFQHS
jgi:hypothetical protein